MILKLVVIAATGLKDAHLISKMNPFTVINFAGCLPDRGIKTHTNPGCNPVWSSYLELKILQTELHQNSLTLVFQIFSKNKLGRDREIGKVFVSVNDLLDSSNRTGISINTKTVPVTTPSGEIQGELTFSYEFSDNDASVSTVEDVDNEAPATTEESTVGRVLTEILSRACGTIVADVLSDTLF